ncbi:C-C motif chemokine 20-like [Trichomycterus rosablanca]|uniref:C-C motif chemokine 20-like n=1 Tax=Trichomycterus rosablanca TaxID=2290929 RepID=UPI002F35785E
MGKISGAALTLLLVITVSLFFQDEAAFGCCRNYSKGRISINRICGFSIQNMTATCEINAIIFHTCKGRQLCVDPAESWVMDRIYTLR